MSLQVPGARSARRLGVVALWVCVSAVGAAGPAPAASPGEGLAPRRALQRADELFRADRLLAAEGLYRRVLADAVGANRRHCLDRLLAIYARVGRQDLAIRLGLRYEQLLRRDGEAARARELALGVGGCYLTLGHAAEAEAPLRRALADDGGPALPPARRVAALTYLALAVERQGGHDRAVVAWQQAEAFARAQLDGPAARKLDGRQRLAIVRGLATSYRHLKQPRKAIARLEPLLALHDERKEPTEKRDTLQQLAGHLLAADRLEEAEQCLREALALHARHGGDDRMTRGDLAVELARVLQRRNRREASDWLERAAADYQAVRRHGTGFAESGEALRALWKLQELYQRTSQYDRALGLVGPGLEEGPGGFLIRPRLQAERGGLRVVLGQFVESRPLLRDAVAELEKQSPPNLVELPRVLLNLAAAELASDGRGLGAAVKLGTRCLDLYRSYGLPDDLVLVEAHNLLGTCAAQNGEYAVAVKHFRAGLARCPGLGAPAAPYRSNLLLNLALLYKAQGSLAEALKACEEARAVYAGFAEPDSLGLAAFDAARAGMLAARHQLKEANELSAEVLRRCARHKQSEQVLLMTAPLVVTARHCRALYQLWCRDFAGAERTWEEVRKLQGDRSPLLPRTLNYLALTREGLTQLPQAEALYRQAREVQRENPRAFPVTHFTTLWRLADVVDRQGRSKEARGLLREALAVVERARRQIYGDAEQRATFFAQFAPGYEQLIDWCVRDGELEEAVAVATRGRSRTLLDQLQMAGVDPREGLRGPEGEKLRREEAELRRKIAGLRARAQLVPAEALGEAGVQKLQAEFDRAQRRYSEVYREILNASEVYRGLGEQEFSGAALARLRERALGPRKLMLLYYVGRQRGYLLLLGDRSRPVEAFPLTVPEVVARRVAPPKAMALALAGVRGLSLKAKGKGRRVQPELPRPALPGQAVPLGQAVLRALLNN
jgi:tetratricopeptide (TPR) repeat protein